MIVIPRADQPIIRSLLDLDFYKLTMGQLAFLRYPEVPVRYGLTNRTRSVPLAKILDLGQVREELEAVRQLRFTMSELHYLRGTNEYQDRMFREPFLGHLAQLQLPEFLLEASGDQLRLEFPGPWPAAIYWETIALSVINELYYRQQIGSYSQFELRCVEAEGMLRLREKIRQLRCYPELTFTDFGTRRRFSGAWQRRVVEVCAAEMPGQFLGTSNVRAAMDFDLLPMGTDAHESYMAMWGICHGTDDQIRASHRQHLTDWWELYGWGLSIALTDTYGTEFFFSDFIREMAEQWKGLRQDSGDPFAFGERAIAFYRALGIDPREKIIIFSDGLDVETIVKLFRQFHGRIKISFGWGTNLTNDLGFGTLSLVIKLIQSCGFGTVKLSDNLAKAIGLPEDIQRAVRIFGYTNQFSQQPTV